MLALMDGAFWIGSYTLLAITTAIIGLAVAGLYRQQRATAGWTLPSWPLADTPVGGRLPQVLSDLIQAENVDLEGFFLISQSGVDSSAMALAAQHLSSRVGLPLALLIEENDGEIDWDSDLGDASVVRTRTPFLDRAGVMYRPTLLLVAGGVVIEAAGGDLSPHQLKSIFAESLTYAIGKSSATAL